MSVRRRDELHVRRAETGVICGWTDILGGPRNLGETVRRKRARHLSSRSNGRTGLARAALAAGGLTACIVLALTVVAAAATPGLTLTATDATVGGAIHASAELAEVTPTAGEEITFEVFGPGDPTCSGSPLTPAPAPAPVNGPSTYESGDFTTTAAGTYHWRAKYPGDGENEAAESDCTATSTVAKASPGLSGSATASAAAGQTITDEATLSGAFEATGHILFRAYGPGDATCAEAPAYEEQVTVSGNGVYEPAGFAATAGAYRWTASYSGDTNNEEASTACAAAGQTSTSPKRARAQRQRQRLRRRPADDHRRSRSDRRLLPTAPILFRVYGPETGMRPAEPPPGRTSHGADRHRPLRIAGFCTAASGRLSAGRPSTPATPTTRKRARPAGKQGRARR